MTTTAANSSLTLVDPAQERETRFRPLSLKLIVRLFGFMKPHARQRNWLLLTVVLRSAQLPLLAWTVAKILNGPISAAAGHARHGETVDYAPIWIGVGLYAGLAAFTQLTLHFRSRLAMELGEAVVHDLRRDMFAHLQRMTMSYYDRTKLGRIISRMTSDVRAVRAGVQELLFVLMVFGGQIVIAATIMIWANWILALVLLALGPLLWILVRHFRTRLSHAHRNAQESLSRVTSNLAESVNGIRVTQGFVRQDRNASMFGDLVVDHAGYHMATARLQGVFTPMLEATNQIFVAVLFLVGGMLAFSHMIEVSVFIDFLLMAGVFFSAVQNIGNQYTRAMAVMAGAERVFALLDMRPEWVDPSDAVVLEPIRGGVEFRGVTFGYDPERPVLHDIDFKAEAGQTIALVGATGSGKTSIANLICKFYLPTAGELRIDGHDIRRLHSDRLHRQMGIVLQQNFLFTGTVSDNMRFGRPDASDAEVIDAARKLGCLDVIENLPDGFDTQVGERGCNLSLGQRQLVCFARAMLADPRILILDEATSSVDSMTEARIQHALQVLIAARTSFVVAHRLSTIRHADQVLVLDEGRIAERGTHAQLLAADGIYAKLYRQFVRSSDG